jgi:cell volume regulation protein A
MGDGELLLVVGALLAAGLAASLLAARVRVPALALFLGLGMLVGSEGTGWIAFDDYELARTVGIVALALILFEGGLGAGFDEIKPVLAPSIGLAIVGTLVTALVCGAAAAWLFDFSLLEGLLVGAIVSATDGAAIFSLLRTSTLRRRLARTLEGESGFNDPIAVLLVIGFIDWIQHDDYGVLDMAVLFVRQIAIGGAVGLVAGWLAVRAFQRLRLATPGLFPVASTALAGIAFGAADVLHGSGFLAVYIAALSLGSASIPAKRSVVIFHQGLAWVAQIVMFFTLGLLVFPSQLGDVAIEGTLLALVMMFLARPAGAVLGTLGAHFSARERVVLGWAGLRGAVPVVLATFPVIEGVPGSVEFFNIVFFAVLLSTVIQGSTFEPLARALALTTSEPALPAPLAESGTVRRLGAEVVEYPIGPGDAVEGKRVRDLGLPRDALVNVIVRKDQAIPPRGSTRLESGDRLHVLIRSDVAREMDHVLDRWKTGPIGPVERPPPPPRAHEAVFTMRPWREPDGDPGHPAAIAGTEVVEHLRTRRDVPGALVYVADGRYAVSGPSLAVGGRLQVADYARRRLRRATDDRERAWWEEVIGALAIASPPGPAAR